MRRSQGMRGVAAGMVPAALAALAALAGAPAEPVAAQETASDTLVLTLEDALGIARGSNPAYRQAVNSVGLNAPQMRSTWADQVLPSASLSLFNTNYSGNLRRIGEDPLGNPLENPDAEWVYFSGTSQSLQLSWSIQGASLFNALDRQRATNRTRFLEETAAGAELRTSVVRQYFEVLEQRALRGLEEDLRANREVDLEMTRRLFRLAESSRVDVLNAELAIERQELALQQQGAAYRQALLALRSELGDPELPPLRLADEPLPVFDPSVLDEDRLVERALRSNPAVRTAEASFDVARLGVKEAKTSWWPQLNLSYNVWRQAQDPATDALFDVDFGSPLEQRFFISLSVPFFDNTFQNLESIESAEIELSNSEEQLRQSRLETEQQLRGAFIDLRNAWDNLQVNRRAVAIAEEVLELAREEYRLGTRTFQELRDEIEQEADARRELLTSRYAFVDALLNLEEQVGEPVRPADTPGEM